MPTSASRVTSIERVPHGSFCRSPPAALDMLVPNSTFSDSVCADMATDVIEVTTEVSTPRIYINYGADSSDLVGHVLVLLESAVSDGTFESTIQVLATSSRRLGPSDAAAHRRLTAAMASARVDNVVPSNL